MITIRRATVADAAVLSALNVDVQNVHAAALPHIFKQPDSDLFALDFMRERLAEPQTYIWLALLAAEAIGYVLARIVDRPENPFMYGWRYLYVDQISVRPAQRGQGYGGQLLTAVFTLARTEHIDTIALDTWSFNTQAVAFFQKHGFTVFNQRLWHVATPQ